MERVYESERHKEQRLELQNMSEDEFKVRKQEEDDYKNELYLYADKVILKFYTDMLKIHGKERKLLKEKIKLHSTRLKLIGVIGIEVFNQRVDEILPDRKFEI